MLGRYCDALTHLLECVSRSPNLRDGHVWLAASCAQLRQTEQAPRQAAEVLRLEPTYTRDRTARPMMRSASDADHLFCTRLACRGIAVTAESVTHYGPSDPGAYQLVQLVGFDFRSLDATAARIVRVT